MFYRNLFLLLNLLGVFSNGLWAQNIPSFIPTKIKYEFVLKAETTREGGWQQIQLYMDNEAGGWSLAGSDIYWFPSEDCDDIDYDVKNCTSTIRNNLVINWGGVDGEEYAELTYNGYHSSEHIIWDATSDFITR